MKNELKVVLAGMFIFSFLAFAFTGIAVFFESEPSQATEEVGDPHSRGAELQQEQTELEEQADRQSEELKRIEDKQAELEKKQAELEKREKVLIKKEAAEKAKKEAAEKAKKETPTIKNDTMAGFVKNLDIKNYKVVSNGESISIVKYEGEDGASIQIVGKDEVIEEVSLTVPSVSHALVEKVSTQLVGAGVLGDEATDAESVGGHACRYMALYSVDTEVVSSGISFDISYHE